MTPFVPSPLMKPVLAGAVHSSVTFPASGAVELIVGAPGAAFPTAVVVVVFSFEASLSPAAFHAVTLKKYSVLLFRFVTSFVKVAEPVTEIPQPPPAFPYSSRDASSSPKNIKMNRAVPTRRDKSFQ